MRALPCAGWLCGVVFVPGITLSLCVRRLSVCVCVCGLWILCCVWCSHQPATQAGTLT